jgi:putative peptide zinc metalloprotease protein
MVESFLSAEWYRVAALQPRLRSHVDIHRQVFRGEIWHVVQDRHNGRYHRISPAGNFVLNMMDGRRSVQRIWELACDRFADDPPSQDEVIRLLAQLHRSDLVAGEAPPDLEELARRSETQARRSLLMRLRNPMALRVPLLDPDRFLAATATLARPIFTVWGLLVWLAVLVAGGAATALHWAELSGGVVDRILSVENLVLIAVAYPIVKAVHELGHAYATKVWGGEVHELGVMFLVLIPVPYVDASASSAFASTWRRAVVGGAGIMVELALAALAALFWVSAEPGLARAFAFNVMLIGGVSTLFFNGNPLLRFDGYFVLCDVLEIPNLGQRANRYVFYLIERYAFGRVDAESPVTAPGERTWFVLYAVASFFYRMFIAIAISLFIATKLFFVGVALALWSLGVTILWPLLKGLWHVVASPRLRGRRSRAIAAVGVAVALLAAGLFALPLPYGSTAPGVVRVAEERVLRAGADGFVAEVVAAGERVDAGETVLRLEDPALAGRTELLRVRLEEMRRRLDSVLLLDRVQENMLRAQIESLEGRVARAEARAEALTLTAPAAGRAIVPDAGDLAGRFVRQGEKLGYLVGDERLKLRVAVAQDSADLVRSRTEAVAIRFMSEPGRTHPGRVLRQTPEGRATLPSRALATEAGGPFATDPRDPEGLRALDVAFQFVVAPRAPLPVDRVGERAWVRFDHGAEPLAPRLWRAVRRLFLSRFNV